MAAIPVSSARRCIADVFGARGYQHLGGFKFLRDLQPTMSDVTLNPPTQRRCVVCGREDVWDGDDDEWRIRSEDGEKLAGDRFCMHEWDITGNHKPILE